MVILAPGTTAPDGSVIEPWMLPWATVVCAKAATDDKSRPERVINANTMNRALGREIFCFNIVSLPFGNMLVGLLDIKSTLNRGTFVSGKPLRPSAGSLTEQFTGTTLLCNSNSKTYCL